MQAELDNTCIAVAVNLEEGQLASGLTWYNNDESTIFPAVMAVAGYEGTPPDLADAVVIVQDVSGSDDGWSNLVFDQAIASPTGVFYIVFVLPPNEQAVARGAGPGIGYAASSSGGQVYLSADGVDWSTMVTDKALLIEPTIEGAEAKGIRRTLLLPEPRQQQEDEDAGEAAPTVVLPTALLPAFPNPFNPQTTIAYELDTPTDVAIRIFDIRGRLVREFNQAGQQPGHHEVTWKGDDDAGRRMASGVYFVKLAAGSYHGVGRVVMIK